MVIYWIGYILCLLLMLSALYYSHSVCRGKTQPEGLWVVSLKAWWYSYVQKHNLTNTDQKVVWGLLLIMCFIAAFLWPLMLLKAIWNRL